MVGALRNASGPTGSNALVGTPAAYDVSFNTDRPGFGVTPGTPGTARFCLDSASNGRLWFNWTATSNASAGSTCPAAGWTQKVIVSSARNQALSKALFSYDTTTLSSLRSVRIDLYTQIGSSTTKTTHLQSAAAVRSLADTSPTVPDGDIPPGTCDSSDFLTLNIGAGTDSNGVPLNIALYQKTNVSDPEAAWLQVGSGPGSKVLKRASGVNHMVVKITNALGQTQLINRDVTCP